MCVIIHYLCQNCKKETGQRDYVSHTDGQRFTIPDPKSKSAPHDAVMVQSRVPTHSMRVSFLCPHLASTMR